jgi:beta-glucuronidase
VQGSSELHVVIDDPLGEVVDVVGYNEYFGWYYSSYFAAAPGIDEGLVRKAMLGLMPRIRFANACGKPMIISEFGAGAKAGFHSDEAVIWSEEYQAEVYRKQLEMLPQSPAVQGFTPWVLKDFRSHLRELNGIQDTYNRKGLVSETGERKLAFEVLADFYRRQAQSE